MSREDAPVVCAAQQATKSVIRGSTNASGQIFFALDKTAQADCAWSRPGADMQVVVVQLGVVPYVT